MKNYKKKEIDLSKMGERLREWKRFEIEKAKKNGRKFTNADIAEILGSFSADGIEADEHTISLFLNGHRFLKEEKMQIIADRWNVSLDYLYGIVAWKSEEDMFKYFSDESIDMFEKQRAYLSSIGIEFYPVICLFFESIDSLFYSYDDTKQYYSAAGKREADSVLAETIAQRILDKTDTEEDDIDRDTSWKRFKKEWDRIYQDLQENKYESIVDEFNHVGFSRDTKIDRGLDYYIELALPISDYYSRWVDRPKKESLFFDVDNESVSRQAFVLGRLWSKVNDNIVTEQLMFRTIINNVPIGYLAYYKLQTLLNIIDGQCKLLANELIDGSMFLDFHFDN